MIPQTTNKEKKRDQILRAALKVIARQGVGNFKMIDIAEKAGIGKGTLYEYFRSKDELISGVFNQMMVDLQNDLENQLRNIQGPQQQISTIISASCEYFSTQRQMLTVLFDLWAASVPRRRGKQLMPDVDKIYSGFRLLLARIIDTGIAQGLFRKVNSMNVASTIIAVLDGIMFQAVLGLIELDTPEIPESITQTVLQGIVVESGDNNE